MTSVTSKRSVREIAEFVGARLVGDGTVQLTGIASLQSAAAGDLVFVDDEKNLQPAFQSRASAVIAGDFATSHTNPKPLLLSAHPKLAFARAAHLLYPKPARKPGIHPSVMVHL